MKWLFHFKEGTKKNLNTCFKDTLDSARLVGRTAPHWLSVGSTLGEIDYYWMVQVQIGFFRGLFPSSTRRLGIIFWKVKPPATLRFWVMVYHVSPQSENLPWQRVHQGVSTVSFRFSGSWDQQPLHDGFFRHWPIRSCSHLNAGSTPAAILHVVDTSRARIKTLVYLPSGNLT